MCGVLGAAFAGPTPAGSSIVFYYERAFHPRYASGKPQTISMDIEPATNRAGSMLYGEAEPAAADIDQAIGAGGIRQSAKRSRLLMYCLSSGVDHVAQGDH